MVNNKDFEEALKRANRNTIMIGSFKSENGVFTMAGANDILMFDVLPLCYESSVVSNHVDAFKFSYDYEEKYTALIRDQNENVLPIGYDDSSYDLDSKMDTIYDFYNQQLLIFQPYYCYQNKDHVYHKNLRMIDVLEQPTWLKEIESPFFSLVPRVNLDQDTFLKKLQNNEYFTLDYYPGDVYYSLDCICCENTLYFSERFVSNEYNPTSWKYDNSDGNGYVKSIDIKDVVEVIEPNSRIASHYLIIDEEKLMDLQAQMIYLSFEKEVKEKKVEKVEVFEQNDEYDLIQSFRDHVINSSLCYDFDDLVNLHTCLKSSTLTILAGMSGTGKTQLALQYARMLDCQEENNTLLFMPISPSYTEPDDVLGFLNPTNSMYVPSETGLVDFLISAANHPTKMHMVIFDEMNLSQIEYWFSPFISVLEKDVETRYLPLYNGKSNCANKDEYPSRIKMGNNIIFIGTINLDETTKEISDRLLDRAFVINLNKKKFIDLYSQNKREEVNERTYLKTCTNSSLYNQWRTDKNPIEAFSEQEIQFLDELHEIISRYDMQKGVSFRVLKNMGNYINNIPCDYTRKKLVDQKVAFDLVLKQTVMKKISGPDHRLNDMIGTIKHIGDEPRNSLIIDLFDKYSDVSDFSECRKSIRRKAEDLFTYGYTR